MKAMQAWTPQPNETVRWRGNLFTVISCNLGGKCKIKKIATTKRITKKFSDIDVSELEKL